MELMLQSAGRPHEKPVAYQHIFNGISGIARNSQDNLYIQH